ncbi:uncharacterized protein TNCT_311642 [Trichonephila clavata]|uniref:Uncharacterized protein n=1 Tax=Trichonephila clavata TaxID=2740835 RepID=A0A8X6HDN7_TRICU|nr:uncharacterized protein TNCT_311642 [Trichonephila clavata]
MKGKKTNFKVVSYDPTKVIPTLKFHLAPRLTIRMRDLSGVKCLLEFSRNLLLRGGALSGLRKRSCPQPRAMGTHRTARCGQAACCALGFAVAAITLSAMFWIIWCYLGFSIVQISDTQRRALVNYSYTTSKPSSTPKPTNRTETDVFLETSLNSISKSTASTVMRGPTRGESPNQGKEPPKGDTPKGDFAGRPPGGTSHNATGGEPATVSASILNAGEDEGIHVRRVSASNTENTAMDKKENSPDITPTNTYDSVRSDKSPAPPRNEKQPSSRGPDKRDPIQSSRPADRDPDFERDQIPKRLDRERDRYDDDYDDRRSPSRYDRRDRGREPNDRYSKGDTRVYPDERTRLDDRYPLPRDERRGDDRDRDDRYKDYDDRYRYKEDDRYRDVDRHSDDDRYRKDDRYRDDERYRDDDRYRKDDRYRDEDRYRTDDRYRDNDRSRVISRPVERDRYSPRGDDGDRYPRTRDRDYRDPIESSRPVVPPERKSARPDLRDEPRRIPEYDTSARDRPRYSYRDDLPSRALDDRYVDRDDKYRRPSRYDDRDRISPTRVRDEPYISKSTVEEPRVRDDSYLSRPTLIDGLKRDDSRYSEDRSRTRYYDEDRRKGDSLFISPTTVRGADDRDRDGYRTRLQDDRKSDPRYVDREEDVVLDQRSYASEESDGYRRSNSRPNDERNIRRDYDRDDDDYRRSRPKDDYYPSRSRDRLDDRYVEDDDRFPSRRDYGTSRKRDDVDVGTRRDIMEEDRPIRSRSDERLPLLPIEKYPDSDRRYDDSSSRRSSTRDFMPDDRPVRTRPDPVDDRPPRPLMDRYPDDDKRHRDDELPPRSSKRDPFITSSASRDVVVREKRYETARDKPEDRGVEAPMSPERPLNAKDVIEAALRHSDVPDQSPRKVFYPVYDPRVTNLTSPDIIRPSERRGTTITSRKRRSQAV